ncbi:MAG: TLD-domain-containing protein [Linnemannia gamsii]|nr:MAG: TLD-domain-containing protein [Linnemannia gamsii]
MAASTGSAKKGTSGGGGGGLEQDLSETRPTPPLRLLFSSKTSGASFSTLLQKITYQGPTLVVMKDEDGYIFGAYADQDWEQGPKFYGTDRSFLFTIRPTFRIYQPSQGINNNFQYLDSGTKTLPNGIGFGGQLRYFGLWLASDFQTGQSAAEPLCSTFQSPRLSKQQNFKLEEMEVWQVHPSTVERDDAPKHSAMDAHPDAVALLEMANRKMYSKDVRSSENVYDSD